MSARQNLIDPRTIAAIAKAQAEFPPFTRIGQLTIMGFARHAERSDRTPVMCAFVVCSCGQTKFINMGVIRNRAAQSCGCGRRADDLTGQRFGKLVALGRGRHDAKNVYWRVRCACGTETEMPNRSLVEGLSQSCGCARRVELAGQRFGRLIVIERAPAPEGRGASFWRCRCDCGGETVTASDKLKRGHTTSCGCAWPAARDKNHEPTHGLSKSGIWHSYRHMVARCTDPVNPNWPHYGGRGIGVCDRWLNGEGGKLGIECFFADMGPKKPGQSIDRINVNGHYEPGNCRWATKIAQARNKRTALWVTVAGVRMRLSACARLYKVSYEALRRRISNKEQTAEEALKALGVKFPSSPSKPRRKKGGAAECLV